MAKDSLGIAEKIKQLKELLDIGAISQEEFEYKKIALLNPDKETKYLKALELSKFSDEKSLSNAVMLFNSVGEYHNAEQLLIETTERAEKAKNKALYDNAIQLMEENTIVSLNNAINKFRHITDGYDVQELILTCEKRIVELKQQIEEEEKQRKLAEEKAKAELEQLAIEKEQQQKATKRNIIIFVIIVAIAFVGFFIGTEIKKSNDYKNATQLLASEQYQEAYDKFLLLNEYKDSRIKAKLCKYNEAISYSEQKRYEEAYKIFEQLDEFEASKSKSIECKYLFASELLDSKEYKKAFDLFSELNDYEDSEKKKNISKYNYAIELTDDKKYSEASKLFKELENYKDSKKYQAYTKALALSDDDIGKK